MTLSGGVSTVFGISVDLSSLTVSMGVSCVAVGSVVVPVLIGSTGVSTVVAVVSGAGFCSGHSSTDGAVVSVFVLSMTGSVSFGMGSVVSSGTAVSATVVSLTVGSVCILDKVSAGFTAEHALIRSASSRMMIFFMAFASLRVYGSEKREKTPMCKNRICRFDGDGICEYIRLSRNSDGLTLHLFPLRTSNRTPISEKIFEKKKKPSPKLIGKGCQRMH